MAGDFDEGAHPRHSDGKFSEKVQADPGSSMLAGDEALVQEVIRLTGAPENEARTAVAETGTLDDAVRHACQAANVRAFSHQAASFQAQAEQLQEMATDAAVGAAVRRLLMRWPDANQIEMSDETADGNFTFTVFVGGEDVGYMDDFGLTDELWDLSAPINYRQPEWLAKWCVGYHASTCPDSLGLDVDRDTGTVDRAVFNLDLFRDKPAAPAAEPAQTPPVRDLVGELQASLDAAKARREAGGK